MDTLSKTLPVPKQTISSAKKDKVNRLFQNGAKRLLDIVSSVIGLLILSPLFILISIFIKLDSPGPAFFWCFRMGKGGRPFRMLKFRTMYHHMSSFQGPPVTFGGDERITPIGQWLRDSKINELPQLWNVLVGEMSLVGPRPEDVAIAEGWPEDVRREVLSVCPGITSPASILYHDEEHRLTKVNVMREYLETILPDKMRLDRLYVRYKSFTADLDIIFWTLVIILPLTAKAKIPEGYFFAGPATRFLNRYFSWFLRDLVTSMMVVGIVGLLWRVQEPLNWGIDRLSYFALVLAIIFSCINSISGLNRIVWSRATVNNALSLALSCAVVTLFALVMNFVQAYLNWFSIPALPAMMILIIGLLSTLGFMVARYRWGIVIALAARWLDLRQKAPGVGERVLVVGSGEGLQTATWLLRQNDFRYAFSIVGVVDDNNPNQLGMWVDGCLVLGKISDIPDLVDKYNIGVILFTIPEITTELKEIISELSQNFELKVAFIDQMFEVI